MESISPGNPSVGAQRLQAAADLWTSVAMEGGVATYEVHTHNRRYRSRLIHMGFSEQADGRLTRALSANGDVLGIHANFARHLEEMLLQGERLRRIGWEQALALFLDRVEATPLRWFLYGSGALAVRGVDIVPGDLDFHVSDAALAGAIFEDLLVEPVTRMKGWIADWGGRAFSGCLFEWVAGVHADVDEPHPHEQGPTAASRLEHVRWRGRSLALAPLDLQLSVARRRGLDDRVAKILIHMDRRDGQTCES